MFHGMDEERVARAKQFMAEEGIDVLIARLAENVLYLTGYWPIFGASMVIFPRDGDPVLSYPEGEEEFAVDSWVRDQRPYKFFDLERLANPSRDFSTLLKTVWKEKGYGSCVVGYEGSFELVATNNVSAEARVVAPSTIEILRETLPNVTLKDASTALRKARIIKSKIEQEKLRLACEIAGFGFDAARAMMRPGVTEAQVSAAVEAAIHGRGVGYDGIRRAKGYCFAMSGPNSYWSWRPFCVDSARHLRDGETVLLELDTFADGYINDLTRTMVVGKPSSQVEEIFGVVHEALDAALAITKAGTPCRELNAAAFEVIKKHGYATNFKHHVGHGVGLQFHEPPTLHPESHEILEEGMTIAIEPAIYIKGLGGIRTEENVVVTKDGYTLLSTYPRR